MNIVGFYLLKYMFVLLFYSVLNQYVFLQDVDLAEYKPTSINHENQSFAFDAYVTKDKFGRKIHFYVSKTGEAHYQEKLPLVVCIQGSGCQSLFVEIETKRAKMIASTGPEAAILKDLKDKVRVLVVEKPGVPFKFQPEQPGSSMEGPAEFLREFSLPKWVEAINASLKACCKLEGIDSTKVLALGHSEGGQVACELAAANKIVTHVAVMAGGGPTQLFDFIQFARSGQMYDPNATADERERALLEDWNAILAAPNATDKFVLGHTHLRWSTFMTTSPLEAILKSNASVFIAQGTDDTNSHPDSAELLYAELLARSKDVTYLRIDGGDHGFMTHGETDGWIKTNQKAVEWFLKK